MVTSRPDDLPNFENPPVVETVLSVQFEPLRGMGTAHLGLLWHEFSGNFPRTEDQSALAPIVEEFPETARARLGLQLQAFERPPVPRMWFVSERGDEMIQVQADRFIKNWRKAGPGEEYPRYEAVKASFERDFDVFRRFLGQHKIGGPDINQCEVSYVNHIVAGEGWNGFGDFDKVFSVWLAPTAKIPGGAEDVRLQARFVIPDSQGKHVGRLHVDIQPAFRTTDNKPMYLFHLTARGQLGRGIEFFDLGRHWIVKSFAALTSPEMHKVWKRKDIHGNS
jgi:uncharacterized protein (TIGR04255 family)